MDLLKGTNLLVRFLLELCMLAAVGYWGFKTHSSWALKILLGIGLPILIAVIWGWLMAPRSAHRLSGIPFLVMDILLLGAGALALYASGLVNLAWIYAVVLIVSEALRMIWKQ
ncbi:MAG: YrdB family protein [Syntrophothermus sp.]